VFIQITVGIQRANHDFLNLAFSNDTTDQMWRIVKVWMLPDKAQEYSV